MAEDTFDGENFCPAMEQEARIQRLRQEVQKLSRMNATYRELPTSPQPLSASPGVASDNSGVASPSITGESEDASTGVALTAPTTPAAGNAPTASRTRRHLEVTRASTRNSPNDEDAVDSYATGPECSHLQSTTGDRRKGVRLYDRDRDCGFCSSGWRSLCLFESFLLRHRSSR